MSGRPSSNTPARGGLETWAVLLVLGWTAWRVLPGLGPAPLYNSDSAVPVLLMRGLGSGLTALYYPGQDRFGMWPFLLGRWLHLDTPEAMHVLALAVLCSAALPLARVLGSPALGVLVAVGPVALSTSVAWNFFGGQPYLWQVVTLAWAWWACRGALDGSTPGRRALALLGLAVAAFLSAWISNFSLAVIAGLVLLESVRARASPLRALMPLAVLGADAMALGQMHRAYGEACKRAFGERFRTELVLDGGHLGSNLGSVAAVAWSEQLVLPLLLALGLLGAPRLGRAARFAQAGLVWLAVCSLPALVLVRHFRENDFAGRYLSFATYWASGAAVHGLVMLASRLLPVPAVPVRLLALAVLAVLAPRSPLDPLARAREEAQRLAGPEPRVLLGSYWHVHIPASLAPRGALLPLPQEGDLVRFPVLRGELRPGREVLAPCALDAPDGVLAQRGARMRRTDAPPIEAEGGPWCVHRVDGPALREADPSGRSRPP